VTDNYQDTTNNAAVASNKATSENPIPKPRKKTVVQMLLSESICLADMSQELLCELVNHSTILEEDRRRYITSELPKCSVGS
jgi:hypothetical protein